MADASFTRWPIATVGDAGAARVAIGETRGAWPLVSLIDPAEAALFAPLNPVEGAPAGTMHYDLELASDTGRSGKCAGVIMLVAFDVPADRTAEVERWYDEEHIELLMRAPGWLRARRYRVLSHSGGPRWTSMAFHELRDIAVMDSPERAFARSTAWRAELEKEPWFPAAGRGVFQLL
jgi:hypothetical protein